MPNVLRVVAAILDGQELTLYAENGDTTVIQQGDPRLYGMVTTIIPEIRSKGFALVDLDDGPPNAFQKYEEQSGGFVRFFKIAKKTLSNIFSRRQDAPTVIMGAGTIPEPKNTPAIPVMTISDQQVVDEIIKHAKPSTDSGFTKGVQPVKDVESLEGSTIVAVTADNKVVPNIHNMEKHIHHAVTHNTVGMKHFIDRVSKVQRGHSVQDLMQFMQHGDLPIADDGSIIIYKILYRKQNEKNHYIDAHTKLITQRVGSYVFMNEKLVDMDRSVDCSNGLHVAQRSYLSGFHGDVCVLGRVRPEDVIAVPRHATNKMRVCGYEILAELSDDAFRKLKSNKPFTDSSTDQQLLAKAIRGEFAPFDQFVEITGQQGKGVKIYPVKTPAAVQPIPEVQTPPTVQALPELAPSQGPDLSAPVVSPKEITQVIAEDKINKPPTRAEIAQGLWTTFNEATSVPDKATAAQFLLDMKKKAKVSWFSLGFKESPEETLKAATKQ
jgi:hypothetical protein